MCGENDGFQAVWPSDWKAINHGHLETIKGNWRQCRATDRSADSTLKYNLHQFNRHTGGEYVCIAAGGSGTALSGTRYLYRFKRNNTGGFDLCAAARCSGHNYDDPLDIGFPANTYRVAAHIPAPVPAAVAPAPAPVEPAPAPAVQGPAQRTWADIAKGR